MTERKIITGEGVPASHLPFSPGLKNGNYLFISGQASVDLYGKIITGSFEEECRRSFDNLTKILKAAGLNMENVVLIRNYVGKESFLLEFNDIYKEYFSEPFPARTTLIGCLGDLLKFEVDAIAAY